MKPELLVVWPNRPNAMAQLEETFTLHHLWNADDPDGMMAEVCGRVRGVVASGEKGVDRAAIARMPKLEIVSVYGVGVDATDVAACHERGIPVTNTPDVLTEDVADMGLVLMLAVLRRIVANDRFVREGKWKLRPAVLATCPKGKTLGIVGLGRIGKALAERAEVLGMTVVYHGRHEQAGEGRRYYGDLAAMARDCDVLALCCPGGAATRHMVNAEVLEALGPESYLVNIARGSVVDEQALVPALVEKKIAGAGLDVFEDEPNVPEALFGLEHVVLQPHMASATSETRDAMAQLVVDNLRAHFGGRPLLTPVG